MSYKLDNLISQVDKKQIPAHVAIIMDGNGRWAKKQGFNRVFGHKKGVTAAREIIDIANDLKIKNVTLYTFSKENWNRPAFEIKALMSLLVETITKETKALMEKKIKVNIIGNMEDLPKAAAKAMTSTIETTKNNEGMNLFIALSYSGRNEIIKAVNNILKSGKKEVSEESFGDYLFTKNVPDPELIIRTGGEFRVSNFLLWQIAYSEFYVSDIFWPDFTKEDFVEAILDYQSRERRFGKTSEQVLGKI